MRSDVVVTYSAATGKLASSPQLVQPGRPPRAKSSRYGPGLQSSMIGKLIRLAAVLALTGGDEVHQRRAGARVRACLPRTPNSTVSVTLRK